MVLAVCVFLVIFVAPIHLVSFDDPYDRLIISLIQVFIAIIAVVVFVFALSKLKKLYVRKQMNLG